MAPNMYQDSPPRQRIHTIPDQQALTNGEALGRYTRMSGRTRKMISHPDDSDDGLLGESTYEILSDLSIPTNSDDDDDLSSLASLAEYSGDDDEEDEEEETEIKHEKESEPKFAFPCPSLEASQQTLEDPHHSTYAESIPDVPDSFELPGIPTYNGLDRHEPPTSHDVISEDSLSGVTIQLKDEDVPLGEDALLSYDIQEFTGPELDDLRSAVSVPRDVPVLYSVLRCSMGLEPVDVTDTFRVLYVGDESAKDEIFRKLGAALVVHSASESLEDSKSSSRFNVVPVTSFGNDSANPEVELVESFGLEMAVDTCTFATTTSQTDGELLTLVIKPKMTIRSRRIANAYKLEAPGWRLPHLAIIYCEANDDIQKRETRACARAFFARHGIPFLSISDKKLYKSAEDYQIDYRILHMAIESRGVDESGNLAREVYKELPVDLQSFLSLDAQQLSRSLAVVVKQEDDDQTAPVETIHSPWEKALQIITDTLEGNDPEQYVHIAKMILFGLLLSTICLCISISTAAFMKPAAIPHNASTSISTTVDASVTKATQVSTSLSIISSTKSISKLAPTKQSSASSSYFSISARSKASSSAISKSSPSSLVSRGVTSLSVKDIPSLPANDSNEFAMYTISEGHIVLRSPQKFAALRKAPALIVHVKRREQTVPIEFTKLFRGVYAIKMDLSEAWGVLNITIKTESKPIINQSFVLDLGNPWLSTSAWKRTVLATSSDLRKAMNKASSKANVYAQKLQKSSKKQIDSARKDVKYLQKEAVQLQKELAKQSKVAKKMVESQFKVLKGGFDELKLEQYVKLDQYVNSNTLKEYGQKFDEQVRKARKNANRIWVRGAGGARKAAGRKDSKARQSRTYSWKKAKSCRIGKCAGRV
ncbi:hypothetical protein Dda_2719 [Drechslerella dactyloides]|uniref:Uncharacterized protein n=1 Tax=Drechslerella dactyloides TaxID=74499 RepID=A0AAD6J039_DREDA|nr:hypothetical protein Dda_2719 [Drechslerella dactyloides]